MVEVRLLGSGSGVLAGRRSQSMVLVRDDGGRGLLIDAGQPLQRRLYEEAVDPRVIDAVIITHIHADHIMGLPGLLFEIDALGATESPLIFLGERSLLTAKPMLEAFKPRRLALRVESVPDGRIHNFEAAGFRVETFPVRHSLPTFGVRVFDRRGRCILFYSSDTVYLEHLKDLAECEVGIHEATIPEGMASEAEERGFHSTPSQALEVLEKSRYKVLYHISEYSFRDGYPEGEYMVSFDGLSLRL